MYDASSETVACPLCGCADSIVVHSLRDHLFGRAGEFVLVRCTSCSLRYLNPRPTFGALAAYYPDDYFCYGPLLRADPHRGMGDLTAQLARQRIRQLERHVGTIPRSARVLDVGCGANAFLYHLHRLRGCDTLGMDFNASVAEAIRSRLGMPALHGSLLTADLAPESFDGVAMYEYIEHEGAPRDVLDAARRATRPGGWLVLETPNAASGLARLFGRKWCQYDTPRHLVLFEPRTLSTLLERCGYDVIAVRPLCYQWMIGFSILVALGFRNLGRLRPHELVLAVAATLPVLPLPWLMPEFMRVYARRK
jgi:SAM-dependent methyltransferase